MTEELIEQIKQNNRKAQEEFYKRYSVQMFRLTYRYVNNEQDAGSIVNFGFYKIFNSISRFYYHNEISFIAWMKRIVINEALSFLRQKVTYDEISDKQSDSMANENILENNLLLEDYYSLIRNLPQDLRTVFNLYAIDGYTHKEIANKLHIKESSSRVYLMRARKILQQNLTKTIEK
jgi:RNA polymerase sigma-70 factor (ECF subfamily)